MGGVPGYFEFCNALKDTNYEEHESYVDPSVAKERGLQRQGIKGEDVIFYFEPLITRHLGHSLFPNGLKI